MSKQTTNSTAIHEKVKMYADEFKSGKLSRREFVTRATALGASSAAAFALIGASNTESCYLDKPS